MARLADVGFGYRVVPADGEPREEFNHAVARGFLGSRSTPERMQAMMAAHPRPEVRRVGVYDPQGARPQQPIGTTGSWVMDVTIDEDRVLPMWSITSVTVAATHHRRGIARALLEGELRAAASAGLPIAGLTVSEATLYGRYGFGQADHTGIWTIDARRAGWVGPRPTANPGGGRLDHIEREELRADLVALNERTRGSRPGDIEGWGQLWDQIAGLSPGQHDDKVRGVRYTDSGGVVQGVVSYTVEENPQDFTRSTILVHALVTADDDAYAALWRYLIEHDLVGTIKTELRSLHEPLRWMVADERALAVTERDHHWLRILDLPACLQARRLRAPGSATLRVTDPLDIVAGDWRLVVALDGDVEVTTAEPGVEPDVTLSVSALSSMLLGGVTASTLRAAGRIVAATDTVRWLDLAFLPVTAPRLSFWY